MGIDRNTVIVSVAPVCHVGGHLPAESRNPLTAEEVAAETIRCWNAGASMVHLHVRDEQGTQVSDLEVFGRTIDSIREKSDIILQGSTGGLTTLSLEERCVSLNDPRIEMASLNMGSVNFGEQVYINTIPDIRYWAHRMNETDVVPELEVFNPSMVESAYELLDEGVLSQPLHFNFTLGFPSSLSADPRHISYLASLLPPDDPWGFLHEGMTDFRSITAALGLGAQILRVGFEDGGYIRPDRPATHNAELVEHLVQLVIHAGKRVATPQEAREILELPALFRSDTGG